MDVDGLIEDLRGVSGDHPEKGYSRLLEPLGFAPLEPLDGIPKETLWALESARVQELRLTASGNEVLLNLRFDLGMFRSASRVMVLRRVGKQLCPLSLALSRDIEGFSCLSDEEPPLSIDAESIVSDEFETLVVTSRRGSCDGYATHRGAHHEIEIWGFVGEELKQLFQVETFDAWYDSPVPPLRTLERKLQFIGAPPKSLLLTTDVTCDRQPEHDPDEPCEEEHGEARFSYRAGSFQ